MGFVTNFPLSSVRAKTGVLVLGDGFNAHVRTLSTSRACLSERCAEHTPRADIRDKLLMFCMYYRLFLFYEDLRYGSRHKTVWPSNSTNTLDQTGHIAVKYCWRCSSPNCRFYWSMYVESENTLVLI